MPAPLLSWKLQKVAAFPPSSSLFVWGGVMWWFFVWFFLFVCFARTAQQESILVAVFILTPKFLKFWGEFTDCLHSGTAVSSKINWFCTPNLHATGWVSPVVENICICYGSRERMMLWFPFATTMKTSAIFLEPRGPASFLAR